MASTNYRMWVTIDDPKRCSDCKRLHGKIYHRRETIKPRQPLHPSCRCRIIVTYDNYATFIEIV